MSPLEGLGNAEEKRFIGDRADKLQANGQAVRSSTAGDRNGGKTAEIGGAIVAEEQSARGMIRVPAATDTVAINRGCLFTYERGGNGSSGNDEGVELGIGHRRVEVANEGFPLFQGVQIRRGRNLSAEFETRADVFAIVGGTSWEPTGLLMVVGGFCPSDLISGVLGFAQQRDKDFFQIRA